MGFLSNLWSAVKTGVTSIGSTLADAYHSVVGQPASASTAMQFPLAPGASLDKPNMSIAPNMSTPYGPGYTDSQGNQVILQNGRPSPANAVLHTPVVGPVMSVDPNPPMSSTNFSAMRPSTASAASFTPPTDQYGRTSSYDAGTPYYNANGQLVVPRTGFTGMSGEGGSGISLTTPATTGMQGNPGGGGSAFTGLLGAQGTTGASGSSTQSDEEKRKQALAQGKDTSVLNPPVSPHTAKALEAITSPSAAASFQAPPVPDTIDAGYLSEVSDSINKLANSGTSLSANDRQQVISQIATNLMSAKAKLDQQIPTPDKPVVDTKEQLDFLNGQADPFGVKQAMDEFRAANTDLGNLEGTRVDLMKNVQALNEAYKPIIDDIKKNPDLPKALARRRIEDLSTTQKTVLQGFLDQLTIVNQQIDDENQKVNRAFSIATFASNQADKMQDNIRQNLQLYISTGAIAGFSTEELKAYAQAANLPYQALVTARDKAVSPKVNVVQKTDKNGDLVGIDDNTGKEVWRIKGFDKPAGSTTQGSEWQNQQSEISAGKQMLSKKTPSGAPITDANGYFTVDGFQYLLNNTTLPRDTFIKEFAGNISPWNSKNYGLTPAERKSLGYD